MGISRRDFIKTTAVGLTAAALVPLSSYGATGNNTNRIIYEEPFHIIVDFDLVKKYAGKVKSYAGPHPNQEYAKRVYNKILNLIDITPEENIGYASSNECFIVNKENADRIGKKGRKVLIHGALSDERRDASWDVDIERLHMENEGFTSVKINPETTLYRDILDGTKQNPNAALARETLHEK